MLKNTAGQKIGAQVLSLTDGSAFTGAVTVYVCGDAGTQSIGSVGGGACTHEGNGYHTYAPSQAETNYDLVAFTFVGTGALTTTVQIYTITSASGLTQADVRTAVGLSSANLDTQISTLTAYVDTEVAAIKAKTDNLPASPAATGDAMTLTSAYDAAKTAASQASVNSIPTTPLLAANYTAPDNSSIAAIKAKTDNLPSDPADQSLIEAAITSATSGLATASALSTVATYVDTEVAAIKGVTDKLDTALAQNGAVYDFTASALHLAPGSATPPTAVQIRQELDSNSTQLAAILADTNELQTDWTNDGRLDLLVDSLVTKVTSVQTQMSLLSPTTDTADSFQLVSGSVISGSYVNTFSDDDVRHTLAPVAVTGLNAIYTFNCGLSRSPLSVGINGYWNGSGQVCEVYAYDYRNETWTKLSNSTTRFASRTSETNYAYSLNREHMDIASVPGEVKIRFVSTSTNTAHRLFVDRLVVNTVADESFSGTSTLSAQNIWEYGLRTLTSNSGEPATPQDIADAFLNRNIEGGDDAGTQVKTVLSLTSTDLPLILEDTGTTLDGLIQNIPTVSEFEARTLPAATYFDPATDTVARVTLVDTTTNLTNKTTPQQVWEYTTRALTDKTEFGLTSAYDAAKTAASQTSVNDLPTNSELATALAGADDAILAVIGTAGNGLTALASAANLATLAGYVDTEVAAIKAKTDNLPDSPAAVGSEMVLTSAYDAAKTAASQSSVTAIKAKTDNLPSDPADQSAVEAAIVSATSGLATASALATVATYVDTEVAAIKAKTDNLPASPAATGDAMSLVSAYDAAKTAASQASVNALHDFDPVTDVVAHVTLVDTTTTLTNALDIQVPTEAEVASAVRTELAVELAHLDQNVSAAKTLTSAYDAAKTAASQSSVDAIPTTPLLAANYVAPANADIAAIKASVDALNDFDPAHDVVAHVNLVDATVNVTNLVTPEDVWTYHLRTLTPGGILPDPAPPATVETSGTNMALSPGKLNLVIYQGATFKRQLRFKDNLTGAAINLTGATVRMQIRPSVSSSTILLSLTVTNGRVLMTDPVNGTLMLYIADETTAALDFRKAVHDIEIEYADGTVDRVLQGSVILSPEVTRPEVVVP